MRYVAVILLAVFTAWGAKAQEVQRIAAVVNDDVISLFDLKGRIDIAIAATGLRPSPDVRRQILPQVMRSLIDDALKIQEAERSNLAPTQAEVDKAIASIAAQNNVPIERFDAFLERQNIKRSALETQVRAEIAWAKLINQRLRPSIEVPDEQVEEELARLRANRDKPEHLVSEIVLRVDSPETEGEIRANARRILDDLRSGADFAAVARQFSNGGTAADGGNLGWVRSGQLPEALDAAIADLEIGEISDPIRTIDGFHILQLRERRRVLANPEDAGAVNLTQVLLGLPGNADADEHASQRNLAKAIADSVSGCDDMNAVIESLNSPMSGPLGTVEVKDLPEAFQDVVMRLGIGEPSEPIETDRGYHVLMVCDRELPETPTITRAEVERQLVNERLEMRARRLLRDLRQTAFVDIRLRS